MKIGPGRWIGQPCIEVAPTATEIASNSGLDPIAWRIAEFETARWSIPEVHVGNGKLSVVPRYKGYVVPTGEDLEREYKLLEVRIRDHLSMKHKRGQEHAL